MKNRIHHRLKSSWSIREALNATLGILTEINGIDQKGGG
jgi:hypothetical protein